MIHDSNWDEICLLQKSFFTIWQSYMTWFSWHFGIHVVALGSVFSVELLRESDVLPWAAVFMGVFGCLGLVAAYMMRKYDAASRTRLIELIGYEQSSVVLFGKPILRWAIIGTLTTKLLILIAWIYVAVKFSQHA